MDSIYLDHNASTPLLPAVVDAMAECQHRYFANPSSQHAAGRAARQRLEDAREAIAAMLGARLGGRDADRLVFTSGGTEANNLALLGLGPPRLAISAIEHHSVRSAAEELCRRGTRRDVLPVSSQGVVEPGAVESQLSAAPVDLVSLMWANNDTGAIQPIVEVAEVGHRHGALVHCDAVQAIGKLAVDFRGAALDLMTIAAHKAHGPRGIGALIVRASIALRPVLHGGPQEFELRPGTEAVALAVGFQKSLELADAEREARAARLTALRDRFEHGLRAALTEARVRVHAQGAPRLPTTSYVSFRGVDRRELLIALDLAGVQCSSGSACASGSEQPSTTLAAMGCAKVDLDSALRFSFGVTTTEREIDEAVRRIAEVHRRFTPM